ncbi:hypothetical protein PYCC9005_004740 [Savitreella phatthalungensis]
MPELDLLLGLRGHAGDQEVLLAHAEHVRSVWARTSRSQASRKAVQSGKLSLNGLESSLNKEFIDGALLLSDDLDIDEIQASELLADGADSAVTYDRDALAAARYIYETSRLVVFDLLCGCIAARIDIQKLLGGDYVQIAKDAVVQMEYVRGRLAKGEEAEKRQLLIGGQGDATDSGALLEQHELLSLLLCELVRIHPIHEVLGELVDYLTGQEQVSLIVAHAAAVFTAAIQAPSSDVHATSSLFRRWHKIVIGTWSNSGLKAMFGLTLAAELNGLCRQHEQMSSDFDYDGDVLAVARRAVKEHAFESLLTLEMFCADKVETDHPFWSFLRTSALVGYVPSPRYSPSVRFLDELRASHRTLTHSCIANLADVLREVQLEEEDANLAAEEEGRTEVTHFTELFLGVIAASWPSEAVAFWTERDSDLHGFLIWGSYWQSSSLTYAYYSMLSSLVSSEECARLAAAFLDSESPAEDKLPRPSPSVSWQFIFDALRYYARHLTAVAEPPELDTPTVLVLVGYLSLMGSVVRQLPPSSIAQLQSQFDAAGSIVQLMSCRVPSELHASLLGALSAFVATPEFQARTFTLLDTWLTTLERFYAARTSRSELMRLFCNGRPDLSKVLVDLSSELFRARAGPFALSQPVGMSTAQLAEYAHFVLLCLDGCLTGEADLQRIALLHSCLQFIAASLSTLRTSVLGDVAGIADVGERRALSAFLLDYYRLNTAVPLLTALVSDKRRMIQLTSLLADEADDSTLSRRLEPCKGLLLTIIDYVSLSVPLVDEFLDAGGLDVSVLSSADVVVRVAKLAATASHELARPALSILQRLNTPYLLTSLSTADESKAILHGMIHRLRDDEQLRPKVLSILLDGLATRELTLAHFLLGFSIRHGALELGDESGQIGSGVSVLGLLIEATASDDESFAASSMQVLAKLVSNPISADLTLELLRSVDFVLDRLKNVDALSYKYLAALSVLAAREILDARSKGMASKLEEYEHTLLGHEFDRPHLGDLLPAKAPANGPAIESGLIQPSIFAHLLGDADDAVARIDALLQAKTRQLEQIIPEGVGQEASRIRSSLIALLQSGRERDEYMEGVRNWTSLAAVVLGQIDVETVRRLFESLVDEDDDQDIAETLCEAVGVACGALKKTRSRDCLQFANSTLYAITRPCSNNAHREHLYTALLHLLSPRYATATDITRLVRSSSDRLIGLICRDAYLGQSAQKLNALMVLDLLLVAFGASGDTWLGETLSRDGLVQRLAEDFSTLALQVGSTSSSTTPDDATEAVALYCGVLLRIAIGRREVARELVSRDNLVSRVCQAKLFALEDRPTTPRLVSTAVRALRLVVGAVVAAGLSDHHRHKALTPYTPWQASLKRWLSRTPPTTAAFSEMAALVAAAGTLIDSGSAAALEREATM